MTYFLNDNFSFHDFSLFDGLLLFHDPLHFHDAPLLLDVELEAIVSRPQPVSARQFTPKKA